MLYRFPPTGQVCNDPTFLTNAGSPFAKLKIESKAGKRTVFLTEHTLIFVIQGIKLLHFDDTTVKATQDSVLLLKKGVYVMAEYVEEGLMFEAIMIFLPENILKDFVTDFIKSTIAAAIKPWILFSATPLITDFKNQFRQYFEHPLFDYKRLITLKQTEIIMLLLGTSYREDVISFIRSALSRHNNDMANIINQNLLQPMTIKELASLCNRSLATFKRDFQKYFPMSPRQYINKQRLAHAKMLLENTDQPIAEIIQACAFTSSSYFSRSFKRVYGQTPNSTRAKITAN